MTWDTFGLFGALLGDLGRALGEADGLAAGQGQPEGLRLAMVGFSQYRPLAEWDDEAENWLDRRLQGELSAEELSWYGAFAPAVGAFSCFALGALLGKLRADEIDDAGFLLGDAHLAGFIMMRMEDMAAAYEAARGGEPGLPSPAAPPATAPPTAPTPAADAQAAEQHYQKGLQLKRAGNLADAAGELRAAIAADPKHVKAHYALAWVLLDQRDKTGAVVEFREVIKVAPDSQEAKDAQKALDRIR